MSDADKLRQQRLLFYKNDMDRIDRLLSEFLKLANAKCSLLIDKDGHLVTKQGNAQGFDTDTISALVAGSFAATKQMAKILGEEEFSVMFHQGVRDNIQLSLIGERTILAVIFDDKTTVGMVRLYGGEVSKKLAALFQEIVTRKTAPADAGAGMSAGFTSAAKNKLDDLFGS